MSHNATTSRRAPVPAPTSHECPLASLGRNSSAVLDTLTGHTHTLQYHHPLSSSPLDPQAYQMSRKSPNLSIEADDIIYASASAATSMLQQQQQQACDVVDGGVRKNGRDLSNSSNGCLPEMYTLSRSSSHSSLERIAPPVVQQKAATFELRGRHAGGHSAIGNGGHMFSAHSTAALGRQQHTLPAKATNNTPPVANPRNFLTLEHMLQYGRPNAYLLHGNSADTEDSSDTAGGSGRNGMVGARSSRLNRQGGRCSVPTVAGGSVGGGNNSSGSNRSAQYYLEKKMDALYLGNALRGMPLGAEASTFQTERYYLEDGLLERLPDGHMLHHRASSPSETSGSDRYLLNRTNSPANAFSSLNQLDTFSSANHNTSSSSSNLALDQQQQHQQQQQQQQQQHQRYHHTQTKVQSLSDGLCNLGRFSPSLDQGYATLVSPSPTGHTHPHPHSHTHPHTHPHSHAHSHAHQHPHPQPHSHPHANTTITTHTIVHHAPPTSPQTATNGTMSTTATATRRAAETAIGPPPWNRKGPNRAGPFFDRLPDEALIRIFSWFDSCELCNVARVCRRFEQLAWRPVLWKVITLRGEHLNGDKVLKMIFRQLCGQSRNGACPEVERVMLADGCRISDKGLQLLTRRCPELTHLQLQTCVNVTNQALVDALTKCSNLQHLDVTGCSQVTSITPNPNVEPPRRLLLQYLDLTDCMAIDDMGLKIVVKNCPQLVYLYLRRCIQITDAGLKFVPSFCVSLKELSVSDCLNITDFGLYELAKLGAALRYLSVAKCERVSDAGLKVIARRCYKLRYLNARGCEAVSDDSITVLARSCPRLRALDIGKCDVSDAGLRALAESCPNLKKLSLRNCDMITDRGVQCIAYYCRGLQQLNIQDCQISIEGYRAVKKYCKRCIIEHTNPGFC